jgi:signal transduction protein with GAF and PtsI domain
MESTVSVDQFQEELQSWKHELSSFKQEIRLFESQLEHLSSKRLPRDLLAQVEHFQNCFICQKEVIDRLRHDLPDSRHKLEHIIRNMNAPEKLVTLSHGHLRERMYDFRRIYREVSEDFLGFASEWM